MIYKVLLDGVNIHGMADGLELLDGNCSLELNGAGVCNFKLPYNHQYYDLAQPMKSTIDIVEGDTIIWTGRVTSISTNWNKEKTIEAEGALAYLNDSIQRPYLWSNVRLSAFLEDIISTHNSDDAVSANEKFKMGTFAMDDPLVTKEVKYAKTFEVIQDQCIGAHGGYFFIRKEYNSELEKYELYLDWYKNMPSTSDQPVQFGLNLLDLSTELSADEVITRIIPISTDSEGNIVNISSATVSPPEGYYKTGDMVVCTEAETVFGAITEVVNFDGISDPDRLLLQGCDYLKSKQFDHLSIECDVAELSYLGLEYNSFNLGDNVHVISTPHLINKTLTISRIEYNLMSASKKVTMGNPPRQTLSEITGTGSGGTSSSYSSSGGGGGGGGGGSTVSVTPIVLTGTDIATINVNGRDFTLKWNSNDYYNKSTTDTKIADYTKFTQTLQTGLKIAEIELGGNKTDIFTYAGFYYGGEEPSNSFGEDGTIYVKCNKAIDDPAYINPNYTEFSLDFDNWVYDYSDRVELFYKMNTRPNTQGDWPYLFGTRYYGGTTPELALRFNLWSGRRCINVNYYGQYTGDGYIGYESPFDYDNFYALVMDAGSFKVYKDADLNNLYDRVNNGDTPDAYWTATSGSGTTNRTMKLFDISTSGAHIDANVYRFRGFNSSGDLIHDYYPEQDGFIDLVDETTYQVESTGHIYHEEVFHYVLEKIYYKIDGIWNLYSVDIPESVIPNPSDPPTDILETVKIGDIVYKTDKVDTIDISWEDYQLLTPEEKEDPSKVYYVHNTPGGGGGGTYVEANPQDTPTDTLETIKIGTTTYDIPGSGGGSYSEEVIFTGDGSETAYNLDDSLDKYDFVSVQIKYSVTGNYICEYMFAVTDLETGPVYRVSADDWYVGFSYTDDTTLTKIDSRNAYVIQIKGIKCGSGSGGTEVEANPQETPTDSLETIKIGNVVYDIPGGGGGDSYNRTSLWSGTQGTAGQITLNDDIDNYDALEFITKLSNGAHNTVVVDAKSFTTDYPYTSSVSASIPHYCLLGYDNCFARVITGSTSSSLYAWDFLDLYLAEVNGIKYGGSGSGGGESYKETTIYEASASADTYHLISPLSNFDAIVCYAKYSGSVQGNFMVSSMFLVDKIETGVNYGICSDDWYTYFSKTDDSNLARSNQDKAFLYKIIGINFGGSSGNEEGKCDSLYKAQSTTPPNTITLSESVTDYDFLVTHIKSSVSGRATIGYTYTVDALSTGDIIGGELAAGNGWIWYTYTDSITLTYLGVAQNYYIEEITGVKIGSGSGKVSKIETGEVLDITAGDGTTSRTFTLSKTPKFVSMSWAADSSWKYDGSFTWGSDRLYFSALDSSPALSGAYLGVSTITYGQDGKSFTITGGNAGGCANTSATTGKLYVDYGEGIGKADVQPSSNYSTTEQVIGTWIDGKPLYQKTVVINNPSTASNISISDLSYDSCFVFDGYLSISGGSNLALNEDERSWVHIYDNKIVWEYSSNYTGLKLVITIRYTKTTDVPGSGSYAELGAPSVHYDTSEHVIGTYFGKPLYRKGFEFATLTFSSQSVSVNNDLANIEDVVNYGGSFYEPRDGRNIPLPFTRKIYNEHVNIQAMVLNSDHTVDLQLVTNSDWYQTIQNVKIWLEYTKTTDT